MGTWGAWNLSSGRKSAGDLHFPVPPWCKVEKRKVWRRGASRELEVGYSEHLAVGRLRCGDNQRWRVTAGVVAGAASAASGEQKAGDEREHEQRATTSVSHGASQGREVLLAGDGTGNGSWGQWKWESGEILVEPMGFEPTTSSMPSRRAPNCATAPPGVGMILYQRVRGREKIRENARR